MHWSATLYIIEEQYVMVQLSDWIPNKKETRNSYIFVLTIDHEMGTVRWRNICKDDHRRWTTQLNEVVKRTPKPATFMLDVTCHVRLHTLLRVVPVIESCCAKFETSQIFKLPTLLAHQCWELLYPLVPRFTAQTHYKKKPNSGCKESNVYSLPFGRAGANIY